MAKKRLYIKDAQGNDVDYNIDATSVTVDGVPLDEVLEDLSAGDSISYNNVDTLVIE